MGPALGAVVGHRDNGHTDLTGDISAAAGVRAHGAGSGAGAFGEYQHITALLQPAYAAGFHIPQGPHWVASVNGNGSQTRQPPSEKWDSQQLLFYNGANRGKVVVQVQGFPRALVFGHDHVGFQIPTTGAYDFYPHAAANTQPGHHEQVPTGKQPVSGAKRQ